MKLIAKVYDYLEELLIVLGLAFMTIMNFANVVSRYCLSSSFSFTEELTIMVFVWVSVFGIAAGFKRCAHLGMSYFVEKFPRRMQAFMALVSMVCSLAMAGVMIQEGITMVEGQIMLEAVTPALQLPLAAQGLSIPVGGFFIAVRSLQAGLKEYRRLNSLAEKREGAST